MGPPLSTGGERSWSCADAVESWHCPMSQAAVEILSIAEKRSRGGGRASGHCPLIPISFRSPAYLKKYVSG
jgi:hypothetical protein